MKKIFISGKYTAEDPVHVEYNIQVARKVAIDIIKKQNDYFPIVPHMNTAHFDSHNELKHVSYGYWIEGYLEILEMCDCIFMLPNWESSQGACKEYAKAGAMGIPIYFNVEDLK